MSKSFSIFLIQYIFFSKLLNFWRQIILESFLELSLFGCDEIHSLLTLWKKISISSPNLLCACKVWKRLKVSSLAWKEHLCYKNNGQCLAVRIYIYLVLDALGRSLLKALKKQELHSACMPHANLVLLLCLSNLQHVSRTGYMHRCKQLTIPLMILPTSFTWASPRILLLFNTW